MERWSGSTNALYFATRDLEGRTASPSAGVIDSQSVKCAEKGGLASIHRGAPALGLDPRDAGKKIKGKTRHLLVDTLGLILHSAVHAADIQDRDGATLVLDEHARRLFPFLEKIFADGT